MIGWNAILVCRKKNRHRGNIMCHQPSPDIVLTFRPEATGTVQATLSTDENNVSRHHVHELFNRWYLQYIIQCYGETHGVLIKVRLQVTTMVITYLRRCRLYALIYIILTGSWASIQSHWIPIGPHTTCLTMSIPLHVCSLYVKFFENSCCVP